MSKNPSQSEIITYHEVSKLLRCNPQEWQQLALPLFLEFRKKAEALLEYNRKQHIPETEDEKGKRMMYMYDIMADEE